LRLGRLLAVAVLTLGLSTSAVAATGDLSPSDRYELGMKYMRRGYYTKALEQFNRLRNYHRDDPASVKAELQIAEIYFKQSDFDQARYAYEDFARLHPRHPDLDLVTYRLGLAIWKRAPSAAGRDQTATRRAISTWSGFETRFPESEHLAEVSENLDIARERLARKELWVARFYAKRDAWGAVRGRCDELLHSYPDADVAPEALSLAARAAHAWGDTPAAQAYRDQLAAAGDDAKALQRVDSLLASPAGVRPESEVFLRPYRMAGASSGAADGGM